jgi:CRP/FNR family transcriptional regulator, cyclic AMP receptor protein
MTMTSDPAISGLLAGTPIFAGVPAEALDEAVAASRRRSYARGQVIFSAGDASDNLLLVVTGRIKVVVRSADGGELVLALVGRGGTVGELGVIDGGSRSADAVMLDAGDVLLVARPVVLDLQARFPGVTEGLLNLVSSGFRRLTDATADLAFLDLPRRVGKALLNQERDTNGLITMPLSQEQLSHLVVGTRQSVNQALRGFERRGWIQVDGRRVRIGDPDGLAHFCGEDLSES